MNELEKKLWIKVRTYLWVLKFVPFVKMAAVCNNLAFGKIDEKSDVDLFVIAKSGHLFTVRIFITFILHILGVRRHGDKVAGRFCLSFFVDDECLDLSKISIDKDIYLAFWIKSMIPIIEDSILDKFLKENMWAKYFFENEKDFVINTSQTFFESRFLKKFLEWIFGGEIGNWFEKMMRNWQMRRASEKAKFADNDASLVIGEHILKFHNIDRRREYRNNWFVKYGENVKLNNEKFLSL